MSETQTTHCEGCCKSWKTSSPNLSGALLLYSPPSDCIPCLHLTGLFVSLLPFWTLLAISTFSAVACLFPAGCLYLTLYIVSVFSCDKRLHSFPGKKARYLCIKISVRKMSVAWINWVFPSHHCWTITLSCIFPTKPLCTGNKQLIFISFPHSQAV